MLGAASQAVAVVALLTIVWSLVQALLAARHDGAGPLWPVAFVIYAGGLIYLASLALAAWGTGLPERASGTTSPRYASLLWVAHLLVISGWWEVVYRGFTARGWLVGLGESLAAWGVTATVALAVECARWILSRRPTVTAAWREAGRPRSLPLLLCIAGALLLRLGLAYLETRDLPNLRPQGAAAAVGQANVTGRRPRQELRVAVEFPPRQR